MSRGTLTPESPSDSDSRVRKVPVTPMEQTYLKQDRESALAFLKRSLFGELQDSDIWKDLRNALPQDFECRPSEEQHQYMDQCASNLIYCF